MWKSNRGYSERTRGRGSQSRGGFGNSRRGGPSWPQRHHSSVLETPTRAKGPLVTLIDVEGLSAALENKEVKPTITDCKYMASYTWLDKTEPTIAIPGTPPAWTPLEEAREIERDAGNYYRDPNAARYPAYPFEPGVQALFRLHPDLDVSSIDIVACSSTLGNLLRFTQSAVRPFQFDVEAIGNSIFFVRRENSPTELIPDVKGYGHTFPEAYTTWGADLPNSISNQRIIRYSFGEFIILLRFETDGYEIDKARDTEENKQPKITKAEVNQNAKDELSQLLEATENFNLVHRAPTHGAELNIVNGGREVPQTAIFDLKTRSFRAKHKNHLEENMGRLWVTQIPNFILAYHENGLFNDIQIMDVQKQVTQWEDDNRNDLARFHALLHRIVDEVRHRLGGKGEVCWPGHGPLQLRKQAGSGSDALPPFLKSRWVEGVNSHCEDSNRANSTGQSLENRSLNKQGSGGGESDSDGDEDYTACSESCGYCGHCSY